MTPACVNQKYAAAALFCILPIVASAFVPNSIHANIFAKSRRLGGSSRPTCPSRPSTDLKYFDDVSRDNSVEWTPSGKELDGVNSNSKQLAGSINMDRVKKQAAKEKAKAMRRFFGHDVQSASLLSEEQIRQETVSWTQDSGLVGAKGAKYDALLGMDVHDGQNLVACLAGFWKFVVAFIKENAESNYTNNLAFSRVFLLVFPNCTALYDYDTMKTLRSAVEFCEDSCTHYGKKFTLSLYHPKYENAPKMVFPGRHSPFPTLGIHIYSENDPNPDSQVSHDNEDEIQGISKTESISGSDIDDLIPQLSEKKRSLELLFNSPAAISPVDSRSFGGGHTYQEISDNDIIATTKQWIEQSIDNTALKYADTVNDRWVISAAEIAEEAYAGVWNEISKLYDYGLQMEKKGNGENIDITSTMFVAKTFSSYSATEFKRFAISVNAALKHLTGGKLFVEPFHPEYVGKVGAKHENRRSPFPTIQICYRFGNTRNPSRR